MNASKYISIVITLSFIVAFPYKASAHKHIPFYATNNNSSQVQICCQGPWNRNSPDPIYLSSGAVDFPFYTVLVDIFSPYRRWCCSVGFDNCDRKTTNDCTGANAILFNLTKGTDKVFLTVSDELSLTETPEGGPNTLTTHAILGDDNTKPKRDRDTFTFNFGPNPGDRLVTVTLEEDPEAGHRGEQATLILRNGNSTIESKTDALPIEITATLPSDGEYRLVVEQNGIPEDVRYRGDYFLSVKSDSGDIQEIKPSEDVEQ
jgi:hypothetical protein